MELDARSEDEIKKRVQKYLEDVPLLVIGSGASMPYGMPSMYNLADYLKESLDSQYTGNKEWMEVSEILDSGVDLETALSKRSLDYNLTKDIVKNTWAYMHKKDLEFFNNYILNESDTFAHVDLLNTLLNTTQRKVSIITTNYDRLFEYASEACGTFYCCKFLGHYFGDHSNLLVYPNHERRVNILAL